MAPVGHNAGAVATMRRAGSLAVLTIWFFVSTTAAVMNDIDLEAVAVSEGTVAPGAFGEHMNSFITWHMLVDICPTWCLKVSHAIRVGVGRHC